MGNTVGDGKEKETLSLLTSTQMVFREVLDKLGFKSEMFDLLSEPMKSLIVRIPVRMDDGSTKIFTGYRAQHNDALGPTIGGIRFHPRVCEDDIKSLAIWMSLKCGIAGLPFGGGKGGVLCNPRTMSMGELERLSRGYVRAISQIVGPTKDIPAPDIYTNAQIMAWMLDEYSKLKQYGSSAFITGKPLVLGGSEGRDIAGALGAAICIEEAAEKQGIRLKGARVIIQGFGNAGGFIAKFLHEAGADIIGISDVYGALYEPDGLNIEYLLKRRDSFGTISTLFDGVITNEELLEQDCDILIPAAVSNQITAQNAHAIKARIVAEVANGPTTIKATRILTERGIFLVPDVLTGAGGVIVSYFEWVQNKQGYYWGREEILDKLREKIVQSFNTVYDLSQSRNINMRLAACMTGIQKMAEASLYRGWV
ncbi:Glu/Leu/Phe/Val family dehydrogenase [Neobacillus rhizophilus]|uniref:Glutamate dehydrogenase n=1 Tax=Neobacillus rhizophilus TaxID=2833579 RepID=A0A942U6J3_9BACI|nr:Glu/Leu/Phe/Val dehydrogenase [Neobacillus rhizophilus]MBS4213392.1 Glu/Leu/Phe/Val dehydrogenase [Neobacillus rhizophilus]